MHENTEVARGASVAPAPTLPLTIRVDDVDGKAGRRFGVDGRVEVWIVAEETPPDGAKRAGRTAIIDGRVHVLRSWVTTLTFANYEHAETAAKTLATACEYLTEAMQATLPSPDDCVHSVVIERHGRRPQQTAVCRRCMTVLADDVDQWWHNVARRGIEADETFAGAPTMAEAIERWANDRKHAGAGAPPMRAYLDAADAMGAAFDAAVNEAKTHNDLSEFRSDPGAR